MVVISEKDRKLIAEEAKEILNKFQIALNRVDFKQKNKNEKVGGFREEVEGNVCDNNFREMMFENAPLKDGNFIIAEKKKWQ